MLKNELGEFLQLWNTHPIRCNKKAGIPHGIPNDLYMMPSDKGNYFRAFQWNSPVRSFVSFNCSYN